MSSSDEEQSTPVARNAFLMLDDGDDDDFSDQGEELPSLIQQKQPEFASGPEPASKSKQKAKPASNDIDNLLAELEIDSAPAASNKKKKKKKSGSGAIADSTNNDDIDILLQSQSEPAELAPASETANQQQADGGGLDDLLAELASPLAVEELESKKKKKPKKKKKEPEPAAAPVASKTNAAILALKQRLEAEKRAEEEFQRQEEERLRKIEEKQRQEEEEAKRKEEERLRKIEEKKRKQEELRRQGKLLTKGQKAKANRDASYVEQLRAQGLIPDKVERPANGAKPKPRRKVKKLTQKEKLLAKAALPEVEQEEALQEEEQNVPEPEPEPVPIRSEPEPEPEISEEDIMSEASSGSVVADWDMDSEDEARLRREKEERRAKRAKARAYRQKQRLIREREKAERQQLELVEESQNKEAEDCHKNFEQKKLDGNGRQSQPTTVASNKNQDQSQPGSESDSEHDAREQSKVDSRARREKRKEAALAERSQTNLRSPICCILGHVDTGKTKILDKIRRTKVQDGEAGGITQQIGASYFPMTAIVEKTKDLNALQKKQLEYKLPGLLIIDTPGHESFTNLRTRGSSLCDIAILVVDIMHGLEQQTKESLQLLRQKKTPFVVALNKVDRIYGWKADPWAPFSTTLANQPEHTREEFEERVRNTIGAFAEEGLNCTLYYRNADFRKNVSLVPTSAITGEGLPDLLMLLVQLCQHMMSERLQYISELQCTVLEVKIVDGIGTTIDVILSNGYLHVNDTIVVCGLHGPIVTTIRALLTPYPMTELRVKGEYQRLKTVRAAAGIKIAASGLEDAIAGSQLLVAGPDDDIEDLKDEVMTDLATILSKVDKSGRGVCVQASTLGSLEALLQFLSDMKIPVSGIGIGPVHKKDVSKAAIMVDKQPEYACILAFDVKVSAEARQHAQERAVRIFTADIIYHLFDQFTAYMKEVQSANMAAAESVVIMPCILEIIPDYVFCRKDPILLGVMIKEGVLRKGTPLCVHEKGDIIIGEVTGMELNHKEVNEAKAGQQVCIKIEPKPGHAACTYGRQFDHTNLLLSKISRQSINVLKANFKDYLSQDDWKCVIKLKKLFNII